MKLQTKRLTIRPYSQNDYSDAFQIFSDPRVCKFLLYDAWNKKSGPLLFQKKLCSPYFACILNGHIIGEVSYRYTEMKETVEIGTSFHWNYHGQGYAKEALSALLQHLFKEQKVHRICANLDARNTHSAHLCENLGMRKEAYFIQDYWNKGEWTDSKIYAILESEWRQLNPQI